jgi:leucyl aminopeptidase (aminopeptidase T)
MTKLDKAAHTVIHQCLQVKKDEKLLIITDEVLLDLALILFKSAHKKTKFAHVLQLPPQYVYDGLDDSVGSMMRNMDIIIAITSISLSHTDARRRACKIGARVVSMPNITRDTFERIAKTDFQSLTHLSRKLRDVLTMAKEIRAWSANGTKLVIPIAKRRGYSDTGLVHERGKFSNMPAGEACVSPEEGKTEGILVVDSGMGVHSEDKEKLVMTIKKGKASRICGGIAAQRFRRQLARFGPESRLVAEFGLGTNSVAKICGYSLEDEKVLGTIHLGFGNNVSFGGINRVPIHVDGVVYNATVVIDGRKILDNGKLVFQ